MPSWYVFVAVTILNCFWLTCICCYLSNMEQGVTGIGNSLHEINVSLKRIAESIDNINDIDVTNHY